MTDAPAFSLPPERAKGAGGRLGPAVKRALDVALSALALALLSPLLLLAAAAVWAESRGPVLYSAERVGAGYRTFRALKFRTMYPDADRRLAELQHLNRYAAPDASLETCPDCAPGAPCSPELVADGGEVLCEALHARRKQATGGSVFVKLERDPRVTRVGRILRKTSLDELPQLINVLRGEMSLVGNRPLPPYEAERLTADPSVRRFDAPAGLTGLWQVSGKDALSYEERIALDNRYAEKPSLARDLSIMARTPKAMLQKGE